MTAMPKKTSRCGRQTMQLKTRTQAQGMRREAEIRKNCIVVQNERREAEVRQEGDESWAAT